MIMICWYFVRMDRVCSESRLEMMETTLTWANCRLCWRRTAWRLTASCEELQRNCWIKVPAVWASVSWPVRDRRRLESVNPNPAEASMSSTLFLKNLWRTSENVVDLQAVLLQQSLQLAQVKVVTIRSNGLSEQTLSVLEYVIYDQNDCSGHLILRVTL